MYKTVRDGKDWKNPRVTILPDGLEVRSSSKQPAVKIPRQGIVKTLLALPLRDWPYGRVVAVQPNCVIASLKDEAAIQANLSRVRAELKQLGITVDVWPP